MHPVLVLLCLSLLGGGDRTFVAGQLDNDCDSTDLDPVGLAEVGIFNIDTLQGDGITAEEVEKQLSINPKTMTDIKAMVDANRRLKQDTESGRMSMEYTQTSKPDLDLRIIYKPTCPLRYYWIKPVYYYFSLATANSRKYCWPYYPISAAGCAQRYCNLAWWKPYPIYWRHRCFPYYSTVWFQARCVIISGGKVKWTSELIARRVPRGCSCKVMPFFESNALKQAQTCPKPK